LFTFRSSFLTKPTYSMYCISKYWADAYGVSVLLIDFS